MSTWPVALFDLDGTLTDPQVGITRCLAHAMAEVGRPVADPNSLRSSIGPPLVEGFGALGVPDHDIDRAIAAYRKRFTTVGIFENALIPGIDELLRQLATSGSRLAVATSKPEPFAIQIVDHFGIGSFFEVVAGATFDNSRRHKEDVILHALESLGLPDADTVVMIGDREHDIFGAQAHRLASIGVLWGFGSRGELRAANADHLASDVAELATLLG